MPENNQSIIAVVEKRMEDARLQFEVELLEAEFDYWDRFGQFLRGEREDF